MREDLETVTSRYLRRNRLTREQLASDDLFKVQQAARVPRQPADFDIGKRRRRPCSLDDKRRIVYYRFGSLEDFSRVHNSFTYISRKVHVPWTTCHAVVNRFVRSGYHFPDLIRAPRSFPCIPRDIQE